MLPMLAAEARERLILDNLPLVPSLAGRLKTVLGASADRDEMEGEGQLALVKAAGRYDPKHPSRATFRTYAYRYIRWAMLDVTREACARLRVFPQEHESQDLAEGGLGE